ncbi:MAG: DUF1328 domain-containing protein [Desulfomonilia bacterium]|uniref:Uncharacterized protein n=1 Tax=anaerobic digester metagenome TaxID=1263854 RepID=A0A485MCS0_9ZZZZ|nr:DUF1328 domain-containing protein [Pseudomonadota bacterium]HON37879.1 DUF1328 domain-containing protein [Deltaproteobacteria bacterium]HPX18227.1 DUF1328 domain-containing protein [Deltaproteobacteria bacterium]
MISWAFIFLVLAIVAAILGFGVLADVFAWLAFILFALFLAIAIALFLAARKVVHKMTD